LISREQVSSTCIFPTAWSRMLLLWSIRRGLLVLMHLLQRLLTLAYVSTHGHVIHIRIEIRVSAEVWVLDGGQLTKLIVISSLSCWSWLRRAKNLVKNLVAKLLSPISQILFVTNTLALSDKVWVAWRPLRCWWLWCHLLWLVLHVKVLFVLSLLAEFIFLLSHLWIFIADVLISSLNQRCCVSWPTRWWHCSWGRATSCMVAAWRSSTWELSRRLLERSLGLPKNVGLIVLLGSAKWVCPYKVSMASVGWSCNRVHRSTLWLLSSITWRLKLLRWWLSFSCSSTEDPLELLARALVSLLFLKEGLILRLSFTLVIVSSLLFKIVLPSNL